MAISPLSLQDRAHLLADTVQRLGSTFVDGGVNPRFGTRNFTLPLHNGQHIEVVCPLDHPATEQTPWGKAVSKKAEAGSLGFLQLKIFQRLKRSLDAAQSKVTALAQMEAIDLKWKQIGVNEITDSRELPFFIQWLTADHPPQDGKAVAAIEKITIADTDHLSDSWFKTEILSGLNGADVEFIDPSTNDGEYGIVSVHLTTPYGIDCSRLEDSQVRFFIKSKSLDHPSSDVKAKAKTVEVEITVDPIRVEEWLRSDLSTSLGCDVKIMWLTLSDT
jgi:hypothetical protein